MRQIFVFGSNTQGRHGKGAALEAVQKWGATYGQSKGFQGNSYAIITKDLTKRGIRTYPLELIEAQVWELLKIAECSNMQDVVFNVQAIGCGLAGYTPEEIAPMFKDAPPNVKLPEVFLNVLNKQA